MGFVENFSFGSDSQNERNGPSTALSPLTNTINPSSSGAANGATKGGIQLPSTPPGLSGKDADKWRKDMAKLLETQRKEEQRQDRQRARDLERSQHLEAKLKKKA
eukprot:CAMPEP_0114157962 /NCGR_PEP_ID=MMETSP0043_2-20121206/26919_1 /TAXON_ID=464988 /ORGANISM="Hemiselmis andersenii, Strain CCMP644" /LENGTH=104 /DNA_ID=CAMNT_0001253601 /DNA_START=116 /DNA_END=427 /DNA_ORIENTATION=+